MHKVGMISSNSWGFCEEENEKINHLKCVGLHNVSSSLSFLLRKKWPYLSIVRAQEQIAMRMSELGEKNPFRTFAGQLCGLVRLPLLQL